MYSNIEIISNLKMVSVKCTLMKNIDSKLSTCIVKQKSTWNFC